MSKKETLAILANHSNRVSHINKNGFIIFVRESGYCSLLETQGPHEPAAIIHNDDFRSEIWTVEAALRYAEFLIAEKEREEMTEERIRENYSFGNDDLEDVSLDTRYQRAFDLVNGDPDAMLRYGHPGDWDHIIVDQILIDACPYNSI